MFRTPIRLGDHQNSRWLAEPLKVPHLSGTPIVVAVRLMPDAIQTAVL
jgi:hypothetical protein